MDLFVPQMQVPCRKKNKGYDIDLMTWIEENGVMHRIKVIFFSPAVHDKRFNLIYEPSS